MSDRKQLNLKLKSDRVERWHNVVEDNPEYASMTDLIRQSVEKEMAGNHNNRQPTGDTNSREIAETKDMVRSMQNEIATLSSIVKDLQNTVKTKQSDKHLRSEVFAAIPPKDGSGGAKSAKEIADELGEPIDEQVVFQVLENLADDVAVIDRIYPEDATESIETKYEKEV